MLSNFVIGAVRTYVPIAVGFLLTWLATSLHVVVDPSSQAGLIGLCVALLSSGYYALARLLEKWQPALGVLLGVPSAPAYQPPAGSDAASVAQAAALADSESAPASPASGQKGA